MTPQKEEQMEPTIDDPDERPLPPATRPRTVYLLLLLLLVVLPGTTVYRHLDFLERDEQVAHRQPLGNGFVVEQRNSGRTFVCDDQRRACILAQQPVKAP